MKKHTILYLIIISCIIMGFVDIMASYAVKSVIKIILFLIVPFGYSFFAKKKIKTFTPNKNSIKFAILAGFLIYFIILGAYFLVKDIFDFSSIVSSLENNIGVNKSNFIWVSLYISFVNSLLEEFFFRGFAFLTLKQMYSKKFAYVFSALMFALYHIAMMIGWFAIPVTILALIGLFIGGIIFNFCNDKSENIYLSWIIHMFANFAINTIGFILFGIL